MGGKLKFYFSIQSKTQPLIISHSREKKASLANSFHKNNISKKIVCIYCNKTKQKEIKYPNKFGDDRQNKKTKSNILRIKTTLIERFHITQYQVKR